MSSSLLDDKISIDCCDAVSSATGHAHRELHGIAVVTDVVKLGHANAVDRIEGVR